MGLVADAIVHLRLNGHWYRGIECHKSFTAAAIIGTPFLSPNVVVSGLWSVTWVKRCP